MRKFLSRLVVYLGFVGTLCSVSQAQEPDRRGEVALRTPYYNGVYATAPIPPEMHVQNEGGSDGAGLCVISSILANGMYQGVPGLNVPDSNGHAGKGSLLWRTAKSRPGGYYPEKLAKLIKEVAPNEKWASFVGRDPTVLDRLSRQGYPIGVTMNTGALYNYQPIHHMVSLVHYRTGELACVVDNNDIGVYHWMPAQEFDRRWPDNGEGWLWIWTRKFRSVHLTEIGLVLIGVAAALFVISRVRNEN